MVGGLVLTGKGRSAGKGNKTRINSARNGKFLEKILITKNEINVLKSKFVSYYKLHNLC
jgi:hypothetical protein